MFADDFLGLAESKEELQGLVDTTKEYFGKWRMKANVSKSAVMVVKGKVPGQGRGRPARVVDSIGEGIVWGELPVPVKDEYKYMGLVLHNSGKWDAHLAYAQEKTVKRANMLAGILNNRAISAQVKRVVALTIVRPRLEFGAGVWHSNSSRQKLDSVQMQVIKSAFHCAATTSHAVLMQELGMRSMSAWADKRMIEMWHRVVNMEDKRLVKQVVFMPVRRIGRGRPQETWIVRVEKLLAEWGINVDDAKAMKKTELKTLLDKKGVELQGEKWDAEKNRSSVLRNYTEFLGGNKNVQFKAPKKYLCGGACNRGRELLLQLRTQSLPLRALTGKFGSRDFDDNADRFQCPVCRNGGESIKHFLLECTGNRGLRDEMCAALEREEAVAMQRFNALTVEHRAWALIDETFWNPNTITAHIAPFVYKSWRARNAVVASSSVVPSGQRVADGSNAVV
jgi:hypothetical protein